MIYRQKLCVSSCENEYMANVSLNTVRKNLHEMNSIHQQGVERSN